MKNRIFDITLAPESGAIASIVLNDDPNKMNWCRDEYVWGHPRSVSRNVHTARERHPLPLISFEQSESSSRSIYETTEMRITVEREFVGEMLRERYTLKNLLACDLFLEQSDVEFTLPFNDIYTYADDCMVNRCNTHIWCADDMMYVNALKMGISECNLGLYMTKGRIASYSVADMNSNVRGLFLLDCAHEELISGEELVWEWYLFKHAGNDDFRRKCAEFDGSILISAEHFTLMRPETIEFEIETKAEDVKVTCFNEEIPTRKTERGFAVSFKPTAFGEHRFTITVGARSTHADFFVTDPLEKLIEKRIDFIIEHQQYNKPESPLDGAYLIYDHKAGHRIFDSIVRDHNACRERMGMPLMIAKYLQKHENPKFRASLYRFVTFLLREFFDSETGEVFDGIGHDRRFIRLYNAPWVATFFSEMYLLDRDEKYLGYILKLLDHYYAGGGYRFYPNGIRPYTIAGTFKAAGHPGYEVVIEHFRKHADNILANDLSYPKHEVNYEQTIVSPAALIISDMAYLTGEEKYFTAARKHIAVLLRFNGHQPSFHLNELPIRYWDDFWFGKSRQFGDTFPHYWSCLSANVCVAYYRASGDESYLKLAEETFRNVLCLFGEHGEGYCAYVYPFRLNNMRGEFYDEWANDQDFELYYYLDDMN